MGQPRTNCTASKRLDLPLPFRPTTQFISAEKGWISGCCLNERKFERVMDLMCMVAVAWRNEVRGDGRRCGFSGRGGGSKINEKGLPADVQRR